MCESFIYIDRDAEGERNNQSSINLHEQEIETISVRANWFHFYSAENWKTYCVKELIDNYLKIDAENGNNIA